MQRIGLDRRRRFQQLRCQRQCLPGRQLHRRRQPGGGVRRAADHQHLARRRGVFHRVAAGGEVGEAERAVGVGHRGGNLVARAVQQRHRHAGIGNPRGRTRGDIQHARLDGRRIGGRRSSFHRQAQRLPVAEREGRRQAGRRVRLAAGLQRQAGGRQVLHLIVPGRQPAEVENPRGIGRRGFDHCTGSVDQFHGRARPAGTCHQQLSGDARGLDRRAAANVDRVGRRIGPHVIDLHRHRELGVACRCPGKAARAADGEISQHVHRGVHGGRRRHRRDHLAVHVESDGGRLPVDPVGVEPGGGIGDVEDVRLVRTTPMRVVVRRHIQLAGRAALPLEHV